MTGGAGRRVRESAAPVREARQTRSRPVVAAVGVAVLLALVVVVAAARWTPPLVEDLRVYRDAAQQVLDGVDLYPPGSTYRAGQPLPFTYPPFAALVLLPTALAPLGAVTAAWWLLSFACLCVLVARGFATLVARFGMVGRWSLVVLLAASAAIGLLPVFDVFGFGQVGLIIAVACLADLGLAVRRSRRSGLLVGLAAAVKLTPGAFALTFLAARRYRAAATAGVTVGIAWILAALVLPGDSRDWLSLALDPERVGPVDAAVNTSWHGFWLRLLGAGPLSSTLWIACAGVTLLVATARSGRLLRDGETVSAATVMGLATVLASPVSWAHHIVWVVPLLGILVGRGRSPLRWLVAAAVAVVFSRPGMAWTTADIGDPGLRGVGDWIWVNACVITMAVAVVALAPERPPADREPTPSATVDRVA